jgi:hypothetical protein
MSSPRSVSVSRTAMIAMAMLSCALVASCSKSPKQALRLNLVPGNTYVLSIRTAADSVLTSPDGNNVPIPTSSVNNFSLLVGDVDDHGDLFVTAQPEDTEFPLVFVPLASIFNTYSFGIKLSPVGRISEFVNTDAMREGVHGFLAAQGSGVTSFGSTPPNVAIALISDDALRAIIEPITSIWPETPVGPGDEWTGPEIYTPTSHTITSSRYRLESSSDSDVKIHVELEIRPAGDHARDPNLLPAGEVNGKGSGDIHVDPLSGTIRSYEVSQETSGTIQTAEGVIYAVTATVRTQAELTAR